MLRTLASGRKVPALAFGTGTALFARDAAFQVVQALEAGFLHVDTAQAYSNEKSVGNGITSYLSSKGLDRSSVFVTTKLGSKKPNQSVRDVLKRELADLAVDYVDLYLIHSPTPYVGRLGEIWTEFERVKKEGLAKEIGISNFRVGDLEELLGSIEKSGGELPAVHQIEFHPYVYKATLPILEMHKRHNIALASYGGQTAVWKKSEGPVTPELQRISKEMSSRIGRTVSEGQVMLKWLEAKEAITVTTSSKKTRLEEYLAAANLPPLSPQDVEAIDTAGSKLHFRGFLMHMDQPRG